MATATALRTEHDLRHTTRSLLFGIGLWFLHLNVVYALPSLACRWGWFPFSIGRLSGLQVVETIASLVTIALMLLLIYVPLTAWRGFRAEDPPSNQHVLVACVVTLLNTLFLVFVIASLVPIFALNACRQS
jgi:hypothetical protein